MSSFIRRIERQIAESRRLVWDKATKAFHNAPPRKVFYMGRGQRLGATNPKGTELAARKARDAKWGRES